MLVYWNYKSYSFETSNRKHPESDDDDDDIIVVVVVVESS
jgi:hypothetical protein